MAGVLKPITFTREIDGTVIDLIVPKEFIRDIELRGKHLMILIRVTGPDRGKVTDYFEDTQGESFRIETTENNGEEIDNDFSLTSVYLDEGPPLSVDIDIEPAMVRAILDFEMK